MSRDQKNASFAYSLNLLRLLVGMHLITEDEFKKIADISAAYYEVEKICV